MFQPLMEALTCAARLYSQLAIAIASANQAGVTAHCTGLQRRKVLFATQPALRSAPVYQGVAEPRGERGGTAQR